MYKDWSGGRRKLAGGSPQCDRTARRDEGAMCVIGAPHVASGCVKLPYAGPGRPGAVCRYRGEQVFDTPVQSRGLRLMSGKCGNRKRRLVWVTVRAPGTVGVLRSNDVQECAVDLSSESRVAAQHVEREH